MGETKIPKDKLAPLAIDDDDVFGISVSKLLQSNATSNQVLQWSEADEEWKPVSLASGSVFVDREVPTGAINGSNKIFTIAHLPSPPSSLQLFHGGILLLQGIGNDYVIDNQTITMTNAPEVNDVLVAFYRR